MIVVEGLGPDLTPLRARLTRLVVRDVEGNIVAFFHTGPDGRSMVLTVIGDPEFANTLAEYGIDQTTIIDYLEKK